MKAYRHDFDVIATLILGADTAGVSDMPAGDSRYVTVKVLVVQSFCAPVHSVMVHG